MKSRSFFAFDLLVLGAAISLSVIGILFIYSSAVSSDGILQNREYIKQIVWTALGITLMISLSFFDYTRLRSLSLYIYMINLLLLVAVILFGNVVNGARSWISIRGIGIQPSEFMKISLIIRLAFYFEDSSGKHSDFARFIIGGLYTLVPMALVLLQPDMGTALVYIPIFLVTAFMAGIRKRYILFVLLAGIITVFFVIIPAWDAYIVTEKTVFFGKDPDKQEDSTCNHRGSLRYLYFMRIRTCFPEKKIFLLDWLFYPDIYNCVRTYLCSRRLSEGLSAEKADNIS